MATLRLQSGSGIDFGGSFTLSATDAEQMSSITAGAVAASHALVLDSSNDLASGQVNFNGANLHLESGTFELSDTLTVNSGGTLAVASGASLTVADAPTASTDVVNKSYVDTVASGLSAKDAVIAASTADFTGFSSGVITQANSLLTVDGEFPTTGDSVLLKDQTNEEENGVYTVTSHGGSTGFIIKTIRNGEASASPAQWTVQCVADSSSSLDGTWFQLPRGDGTEEGFWIDIGDSGTAAPSGGSVPTNMNEISASGNGSTSIAADDTAADVAAAVQDAIDNHTHFSATVSGDTVTVTAAANGAPARNLAHDGDTIGAGGALTNDAVLTRRDDMNGPEEFGGSFVFVQRGETHADQGWVCTTDGPIEVNTDLVAFTQFSSSGSVTAGNGLTDTSGTFSVKAETGTGLTVGANGVGIRMNLLNENTTYGGNLRVLTSRSGSTSTPGYTTLGNLLTDVFTDGSGNGGAFRYDSGHVYLDFGEVSAITAGTLAASHEFLANTAGDNHLRVTAADISTYVQGVLAGDGITAADTDTPTDLAGSVGLRLDSSVATNANVGAISSAVQIGDNTKGTWRIFTENTDTTDDTTKLVFAYATAADTYVEAGSFAMP